MEKNKKYLAALTIAGSDSGGGAGIQADLKTFSSLGIFGTSAITAITAQNTHQVRGVEVLSPDIIRLQIETVLDDIQVNVVKTGMLPTSGIVEVVAQVADQYKIPRLVVDPVLISTSGTQLASEEIIAAYRELLYRHITLLTPNIPELIRLSGIHIYDEFDIHRAVDVLFTQGCKAILVKGGHRSGKRSSDTLFTYDHAPQTFSSDFIETNNLHGTGCTLASAIASYLAMGYELAEAVKRSKIYITSAILAGKDIVVGMGNGPLNHFFEPKSLKIKIE